MGMRKRGPGDTRRRTASHSPSCRPRMRSRGIPPAPLPCVALSPEKNEAGRACEHDGRHRDQADAAEQQLHRHAARRHVHTEEPAIVRAEHIVAGDAGVEDRVLVGNVERRSERPPVVEQQRQDAHDDARRIARGTTHATTRRQEIRAHGDCHERQRVFGGDREPGQRPRKCRQLEVGVYRGAA